MLSTFAFGTAPLLVIDIGLNPVLVHVGPLAVHWYGVMYVVGIVAGLQAAFPYLEARGITREDVYSVFWPVLVAALAGGRLYYVVQSNLGWYLRHPGNILATWEGGMAFYGAVLLGVPALYIMCQVRHLPFLLGLDAVALLAPLAQTFGRIGNLINGDIVGYPSTLPWATRYTNPANTFVSSHTVAYQPAAGYELLFSLALFAFLWSVRNRYYRRGDLFALWLALYSIGQFVLFFFRANTVVWAGLKQAQLTAAVVLLLVLAATFIRRSHRRSNDRQPARVAREDAAHPV